MNTIIRIITLVCISNALVAQSGYELVWADEFDYTGLPDDNKWGYDVGDGCPNVCGWGNNELEYYTEKRLENARVEDGHLIITAIKEKMRTKEYSSARLVTRGKGDWTYGRIEVKAKLPTGIGTWPAIWMLSTDWSYGGWPESGEIDIMEHVGYEPDKIYGTVHTKAYHHSIGTQKGADIEIVDCEEEFHVYAVEWSHSKIDFFVDDNKYFTFSKEEGSEKWPFDKRFHLLLNIAVGGTWGGAQGIDASVFPQKMLVDYVRVYQMVTDVDRNKGTGQLMLYPNPMDSKQFTIKSEGLNLDEIMIYNTSGHRVDFNEIIKKERVEIQLKNETSQLLLVSLVTRGGEVFRRKIFVN